MSKKDALLELKPLLNKAGEFHGHLGPFLVIGVRMGLIGLRELGIAKNYRQLHVTAMVKSTVPFTCVLDGIQMTTQCTFGNQKLKVKEFSGIEAEFELENGEQNVTVAVNPATFNSIKGELVARNVSLEEVRQLALKVASISEEKLFIVKRG
ncbi:MAG: formylmethanofuran dehydrogenase subunit E family protein [Thermoproteota archaeon]|nr:formylmethanofuran dehydrogenase subunit E family protein [Thermoproteota archaeon]